jgi:hypothetical protein
MAGDEKKVVESSMIVQFPIATENAFFFPFFLVLHFLVFLFVPRINGHKGFGIMAF